MKKILAVAIAAIGLCSFSASAQDKAPQCPAQQCPAGESNKMYQPREFTDFAFEGILLDIDQQSAIDTINANFKANQEKMCPQRPQGHRHGQKPCKGQRPEKCNRPCAQAADSCIAAAACDTVTCVEFVNPQQGFAEYVQQVKGVLTPEQYTTFLENILFNTPQHGPAMVRGQKMMRGNCGAQVAPREAQVAPRAEGAMHGQPRAMRPAGKHGPKGQRPAKASTQK